MRPRPKTPCFIFSVILFGCSAPALACPPECPQCEYWDESQCVYICGCYPSPIGFSVWPSTGDRYVCIDDTVTFNAGPYTWDGDGCQLEYSWSFGNDAYDCSDGDSDRESCKYSTTGDRTVNLTVTRVTIPLPESCCYNERTDSFSRTVTVVKVASLVPDVGAEIDDGDGNPDTKSYVVPIAGSGVVTVTATPNPNVSEGNLPGYGYSWGWTLEGGTGTSLLTRTVDRTTAGVTTITCTCGSSSRTTEIIVVGISLDDSPLDLFRESEHEFAIVVTPTWAEELLSVSITGDDGEHVDAMYDSLERTLGIVNAIPRWEVDVYIDHLALDIATMIDGVAGPVFRKNLHLYKTLDPLQDAIKDGITSLIDDINPGEQFGNHVKQVMQSQSYVDPYDNWHTFSPTVINNAAEYVENITNTEFAQSTGVDLWNSMDWQDGTLKESWWWPTNFSLECTITTAGGAITMNEQGPNFDEWRFIQGVNQYGFSSKLFAPESAVIKAKIWTQGHVGQADVHVTLSGSASFVWEGEYDPELDKWLHAGEFSGFSLNLSRNAK